MLKFQIEGKCELLKPGDIDNSQIDTSKLSNAGLVQEGAVLNEGDILYVTRVDTGDKHTIDTPQKYELKWKSEVISVLRDLTCKDKQLITITVQYKCIPQVGDKFSTRSGCKGVISAILEEKDMPRGTHTGAVPDVIFSPLSVVTRMLVG